MLLFQISFQSWWPQFLASHIGSGRKRWGMTVGSSWWSPSKMTTTSPLCSEMSMTLKIFLWIFYLAISTTVWTMSLKMGCHKRLVIVYIFELGFSLFVFRNFLRMTVRSLEIVEIAKFQRYSVYNHVWISLKFVSGNGYNMARWGRCCSFGHRSLQSRRHFPNDIWSEWG